MGVKLPAGLCRVCAAATGNRRRRYCDQHRPSKMHAQQTNGFHSRKEYERYLFLRTLEAALVIQDLRIQVPFPLAVNGQLVTTYKADFVYQEAGVLVVEDAKGYRAAVYKLKKKLFQAVMGFSIRET